MRGFHGNCGKLGRSVNTCGRIDNEMSDHVVKKESSTTLKTLFFMHLDI